jgi:hypothetical protein
LNGCGRTPAKARLLHRTLEDREGHADEVSNRDSRSS